MRPLPPRVRRLTPDRLRDNVRLRALAVGPGLIPPRTMHSARDARVLVDAARGARRVVEIGVYEGSSAVLLCAALGPGAELHLIDPFGRHPDALPGGWAATEWATRRVVARASRRWGAQAPRVRWHVALSHEVAASWSGEADLVFIDGDHSEAGCELDWSCWHRFVPVGGYIVFHDARADRPDGRGLPGPTTFVNRRFRARDQTGRDQPGCERAGGSWELVAEADRTVAVRRVG